MSRTVTKTTFTIALLLMLMAVPALGATVNKSIKIEANSEAGGATSVNGSISIGERAVVTGNVKTVNGTIRVDTGASIEAASTVNGSVRLAAGVQSESLNTVNGSIKVGENAAVDGEIQAVNGRITVDSGSTVANDVSNVNGQIELVGTEVGGNLKTVNGDITLEQESVVKGDLFVEKNSGWGWGKSRSRKPRIIIGPGSRVEGKIILKREVELFISDTAEVGGVEGEMSMDDAVRFSGDRP
ncbi:MAG: hypothetical protein KJO01_12760 [Gammaproteobacteria bacterium]|nr:hypothetical protein [Gammaproteobacteria bacterium]MBT8111108.1 hypothetical protein [Gammaproteobacteria bacterium]NND48025.1 hypothetical protein [Woeseiaceae bacterium]NNL45806.1 hypothetical protein [Woeseiaceae bacterium]